MKNSFSLKLILITLLFFAAGFISYGQTRVKVEVNGSPTACNGTDFSGTYIKRDEDSDGFGIYEHESLGGYEIRRHNKQFWVLANGTTIYNNSPYDGEFPTCGTWTGGSTGDPNNPGFGCFSIEITSGRSGREECSPANTPPSITNIQLSGIPQIGQEITASYTFNDSDDDTESGSTFQWYADDVAINGAVSISFTPTANQLGLALKVEITPSDGISFGTAATKEVGIVSCEDGFTCEVQDVSVCDSNIYQVPNGSLVSENGSYESISGRVKTYYNVTFDRTDIVSDVYVNATIAASGSVTYQASTNATGVLSFDKAQDYWVNMNALQDDLDGTNRSVFMWVKSEADVVSDDQTLFAINTASGGNVALFKIDNDGENLELFDGSDNQSASFDMGDEQWHYVGYTYDASTTETVIYVDGIENDRFNDNQATANDSQYSLGQEFDNANDSDHMNGDMAEISVWAEVLTGAEIREAMRTKINDGHPKYANLVGYYSVFGDCDDDTTVLKDHSGKGNDGVMVNNFTVDFKNVQSIPGFNAIDWYENISWKKDGTEVSTDPAYTFDITTGTYELITTRSFIQSSDSWTLTTNANATTVDQIADETLCSDDPITRTVSASAVNYLDFEESDNNYIDVSGVVNDLVGTSRSIFMWVNKESNVASGDNDILFSIHADNGTESVTNFYIRDNEKLAIYDGVDGVDGGSALANDTWYFVGYTYDAASFETKMYLNGAVIETFTEEMPVASGNTAYLGMELDDNGPSDYFDGKMAEITIWNESLTEEQVAALMATAPAHNAANLVSYYGTFKTIADNRLLDLTANGNDGLVSHNSIIVATEEAELTDYNATANYIFSWKKEGTEFDTDAVGNITIDEGTTNYSVTYGTPLFQKTDEFNLSYTNLIPNEPIDKTAGVLGSVTFEVDEIAGATYRWFKKEPNEELETEGTGFPENPGFVEDITIDGANLYVATRKGLAISNDDGFSWSTITESSGIPNSNVGEIEVDGDKYYLVTQNGGLSISIDAGQTWTTTVPRENGFPASLNPKEVKKVGETLYVATENGLAISSDDGQTWSVVDREKTGFSVSGSLTDVFIAGNSIYLSSEWRSGVGTGGISISEDGGSTWTTTAPGENGFPTSDDQLAVAALGDNIFVGTKTSGLAISSDGGQTWAIKTILKEGYPSTNRVNVLFIEDNNIYAGTGDGLFQSTDFGDSWSVLLGSTPIFALYATDEVIYAGDNKGKLFKLDVASELTDQQDNTVANQIQGATSHRLTINNLSLDQSGLEYFVEVSKDGCTQTSDNATLTVVEAPIIEELSPASGSTDVEIDENLEIEYNDRIELGTGTMRVYNYATDELIRTFSTEVSVVAGDHELGLNSRGEIRSIAMNLEYNTQYYVLVDEGVVLDDDDNPSLVITDKDFWTFKTVCEPLVLTQPEDQIGVIGGSVTFSVPEVAGATYQWRKNEAEAKTINSDNGLSINIPYQVFKSGDMLYVASETGLGVSSDGGETFSIKNVVNGFPISGFTGVAESNSTIYIATSSATAFNSAVKLETQSQVLSAKTFQSEHNGVVVSSVREHNGNIYFGTNYGLYVSTDQGDNFSKLSQDASFNEQKITSLEFYNGSIYLGTQSDGLAISTDNGATFERKTFADGLGSNAINDVFELSGKLYVATENGLSISSDNGDSFVNKSTTDGLENDRVLTVYGSGGMLYAGTSGGLSISTDGGNSFSNSESPTELASNAVYGVDEFEGNLYFSAFDGTNGFVYVLASGLSDGTDSTADNYIIGSNTHELTISNLTEDFNQTEYFVSVTKAECEEISDLVTLSIVDVPIITRVTPVNGSSDLEKDVNITLSFNRAVTLGAGSISVLNYVTDEEVLDINVNDASIINGNTVVLPTASLSLSTKYYLKIDEGVVLDGSEVANLAADTKDTYSFTTKIDFFTAAAEDQVISLGDDAGLELSTGVQGTLQWYQMKSEDETLNVEQVNLNGASIQGNDFEDGKFYYLDGTTENQNRLFIYDLESESIESTTIDYGGRSYLNAVKVKGKLVIVYRTDASNSGVNYLYISTDGGETFKEKQYPEINQFRPSDFVITDSGTFYTFVRMPSDYINPNAFGLFKSIDFGGTFEFIDLTDVADGQSFSSFTSVAVSQNEEQVFVVNASAIYSLNSGQDFTRNSTKFQSADFIGNELYVTLAPRVAYHVPDPTNLLARTKIISSTKTVYEPLLVGDQLMFPYNQSNFGLIREDLTTKTEFVNKLSLESTFGTKAVVNEGKSAYKNYLYLVDNSSRSLVKVKFADIIEGSTTANLSLSDIEESGHYFAIMEYLGTYGYSSFSDVLVAPTLVSVTPTDDATDVSISPALSAEFNIPVQEGSGSILIKRVDNDQLADLIGVTSDVSFDDNIISFQLDLEALENNTEYYVEIAEGVIESLEGVAFAGITDKTTWSFTTASSGAQLGIASLSPTDDAVDLSAEDLNTTIPNFNKFWITFSEGVKYGNTSAEYKLYTAADDLLVASQTLISTLAGPPVGNTTAGFGFYNYTFEPGTSYYILIDAGMYKSVATDGEFSGISDKTAWNFTTKALDAEPLEVTSTFPSATRDALLDFPYINLTFGETTAAGSGAITIYRADDNSVFESIDVSQFRFSNSGTPKQVQVPLTNGWEVGTAYYIQYPTGLITSLDGSKEIEEINDKTSFAFKAESYNENIITSFFPATGSTTYEADSEDELVIYTSVSVGLERDPLGSFRIYKAANDELVKTIEYDGENDRDLDYGDEDNFIKFEFDDDELEPGTEYYVLVDDGFIISYEEGLYHVGISDPTTWRFTTLEEPTTPTFVSSNPASGATDIAISANIELTYSENIQAYVYGEARNTTNNIVLYDANDNEIESFPANSERLSYSGSKVTINPTNNLNYNTTYYVLIDDEAFVSNNEVESEGVSDPTTIRFTTGSQPNTAPVASNVAFSGTMEANQELTGSYDYSDANSDAESGSTLQWYEADDASGANKAAISGATASTFTLTSSEVGKFITFRVIPNDGTDVGTQVLATYVGPVVAAVVPTIVSTVPADGAVDLAKDANLNFVLSESVTKGTGNITLTPVTGSATVIDVTSAEVTVSGTNVSIDPSTDLLEGQFYTVTFDATAFVDADGNNSAGLTSQTTWNFTVKEANVAPEAQGVSIKKSLVVDGVLEGSYTYSDANDDAESGTTFQWYRADDTSGTNRAAISGASSQTYTVVNDDNGKYVSFEVTPNDGVLTGTAKQGAFFGPIVINDGFTNIAPAFTSDAVTSVKDNETYTYSITYEDLNNDVPILSKEVGPIWLTVNGMVISGNPSSADVGDHKIILELVDQFDDKAYQEFTLTVVASNTAPIVNGLEITGTTIIDDQLTASYNFIDAESDADNSSFKWYRSDDNVGTGKTEINGATSTTYTLVAADAGKFISFEVTPNDGKVNGTLAESAAVDPVIKKIPSLSLSAISKTYGDADFDLLAATNSSGTITYTFDNDQTGAAINGSTVTLGNVGEIIVNVNLAEDAEYAAHQVQGAIMVGKKALELTATNTNKNVGETDPMLQFTVTTGSIVGNDEVVTVSRDVGEAPGTYAITFSNGVAAGNYNITTNPGVFTINKALLTITADAATKTYGEADPTFTYSITNGSLNSGDILNGAITRVEGEDAGTYALESDLFNPNYTITFVSADLTIEKATLTATADDLSKTYGDQNPNLTITYSGFVLGDNADDITEPAASTMADATTGVGTYDITLSGGSATNYSLINNKGSLTIDKATLTVTADDKSKTYGEANPALTITYNGFVNGENESAITEPTASTVADATTGVGTYDITLNGGSAANYSLITDHGSLTIGKAVLTATADDKTRTYGETNPTFTISYSGFVNGDDESGITEPIASTSADATTGIGIYDITLSGGSAGNYLLTTVNGSLTIGMATLTVTADNKSKTYGEANPALTITYYGFVNGDDESDIVEPTVLTMVDATSDAGTYDITLSGGSADNYLLLTNNGLLAINKATLTATADNKSKVKGQANPTFTISYAGFVNDDTEADVDTKPVASTTADEITAAGNAVISLSGGSDNNYSFNLVDGTLNIIATSVTTLVTVPAATTYKIGDNLDFEASWLFPVTITGTPSFAVTIGSKTVEAQLLGTVSNSNTSTFRYTVTEGDLDSDGISLGTTVSLNGGTIKDQSGVNALLSLNNIASSNTVFIDGVRPSPTLTTSASAIVNGTFTVTITFDETVNNFQLVDIMVTNGVASNFTSVITGKVWTADIAPTLAGNVTVSLEAGVANDQAGNSSLAGNNIIREINNKPTDIMLSATTIAENNALSTSIGNLSSTDPNSGDSHNYTLVSGTGDTDNSSFVVEGSSLKTNNVSFNFETKATYSIRLKTDDGKGGVFEKAVTITVTNVNEAPISLNLTNAIIDEADAAQEVGSLMSLDPDNGDSFAYTLIDGVGSENNSDFTINGSTLSTVGMINFEHGATRSILVRVTDGGGLTLDKQFTITVEEVVIEPIRDYNTNKLGAEVKNVFSPNGDGVNETWVIDDIKDNPVNEVRVFAQGGKLIYSKVNYQNDWAGTFKGDPIPDGTYYYEINIYNGQKIIKGFLTIIRNR